MVESFGFVPRLMPHAGSVHGHLAGTDAERLDDLITAFRDEEVAAIWCVRGGYGFLRLLGSFDFEIARRHPKPFVGYSDATAFLLALQARAGLPAFHGPIAAAPMVAPAPTEFLEALTRREPLGVVAGGKPAASSPGQVAEGVVALAPGVAEGRLLGGNLSLVCRLLGTPFLPDLEGAILFLEDVGEPAYRVDGMLAHLALAGVLDAVSGVALGRFTDAPRAGMIAELPLETVFRDHLAPKGIPVLSGLRFGHVPDQATLPVGMRARLDADARALTMLESPFA